MKVECIKERYPVGSRVKLIEMAGEPQMKAGLEGTITSIDDIGQIHVNWDNCGSLALVQGEDKFEIIETKKFTVLIVEPCKEPVVADIPDTLSGMQAVVGGNIESFSPYRDGTTIICRADGKLLKLQPNRPIIIKGCKVDVIVGTFFVCATGTEDGENISLTEKQIKKYSECFRL